MVMTILSFRVCVQNGFEELETLISSNRVVFVIAPVVKSAIPFEFKPIVWSIVPSIWYEIVELGVPEK